MGSCLALVLSLFLGIWLAPSGQAADNSYALGPGDKVRVRVSEWRPSRGQVYEWDAVSGEFTINPAGAISVPLIGEIPAANLSTDSLAQLISARLQERVGLVQKPETSAEIVQFRPFYILGAVNRPGDYPYRPGMTVLQAIGIAGGFYRPVEWRFQREVITASGELRVVNTDRSAVLARKARLEAELRDDKTVSYPAELMKQMNDPAVVRFRGQEDVIFESRRGTLRTQTEALQQVQALFQNEIKSLREKLQVQDRQLSLARKEMGAVESLVSKGLSVSARQLSLEQQVAQIESSRVDLSMAIVRAEQEINKAGRDILDLRNRRKDTIAADIKEAEVKLYELTQKAETARALLFESQASVPHVQTELEPTFTLVRRSGGRVQETLVSEHTAVEPDDVIRIRLSKDNDQPREQASQSLGLQDSFNVQGR
jgi:exopolysaccharide production protein ExoF